MLSLAGPVVALAGNEDLLAVVTHASTPLPSGDQALPYLIIGIVALNSWIVLPLLTLDLLHYLNFSV